MKWNTLLGIIIMNLNNGHSYIRLRPNTDIFTVVAFNCEINPEAAKCKAVLCSAEMLLTSAPIEIKI